MMNPSSVKSELETERERRDQLVLRYMPLVKKAITSLATELPVKATWENLESAGMIGLMAAVDRVDSQSTMPFEPIALESIKKTIRDALTNHDDLVSMSDTILPSDTGMYPVVDVKKARNAEPEILLEVARPTTSHKPRPSNPVLHETITFAKEQTFVETQRVDRQRLLTSDREIKQRLRNSKGRTVSDSGEWDGPTTHPKRHTLSDVKEKTGDFPSALLHQTPPENADGRWYSQLAIMLGTMESDLRTLGQQAYSAEPRECVRLASKLVEKIACSSRELLGESEPSAAQTELYDLTDRFLTTAKVAITTSSSNFLWRLFRRARCANLQECMWVLRELPIILERFFTLLGGRFQDRKLALEWVNTSGSYIRQLKQTLSWVDGFQHA